jgi:hypothetical protein
MKENEEKKKEEKKKEDEEWISLISKNKYLFELYNYYFYPSKIIFII